MTRKVFRCAIYTRKSSDEGLDQSFNSLDAQREAGEAYVKSQAHEGWKAVPTMYDDGGYSGGTMERPGLQLLLADIDAGLIDVVVVYKIDRLTRSLPDFARIVERFDARDVSFVSVTQSFNTTSSMGRLTLNVLLSFAQFEREVTGERIRDKIAASKARGMWMGGNVPLGYDLPAPGTRTLQINAEDAERLQQIFSRYLELGSVHALQRELAEQGFHSKQRITGSGKTTGGTPFSRGALFHLLRNRIYLGQIPHKGVFHKGEHDAIVPQDLFDKVQSMLDTNARRHKSANEVRARRAPLTGKLFDAAGETMSPSFSRGKSGQLYRYYVSASLQQGGPANISGIVQRIAAPAIEKLLTELISRWLPTRTDSLDLITSVHLRPDALLVDLPGRYAADIAASVSEDERIIHKTRTSLRIEAPLTLPLRGGKPMIVRGAPQAARPDTALIATLRKAHGMLDHHRRLPVITNAPVSSYDRMILRLALLAPELQRDILTGNQPQSLNLELLRKIEIPLCWKAQREVLGWPAAR